MQAALDEHAATKTVIILRSLYSMSCSLYRNCYQHRHTITSWFSLKLYKKICYKPTLCILLIWANYRQRELSVKPREEKQHTIVYAIEITCNACHC